MLRVVSLFSGIGAFELALREAGVEHEVRLAVEQAPFPARVYRTRFGGGVLAETDIAGLADGAFPEHDLLLGGPPCQDFSVAGPRAGLAGARGSLLGQYLRVLALRRPRWFVLENVPGLLTSGRGLDLLAVLRSLGELGYVGGWRVLDAQFCGVAQQRRRVFLVGRLAQAGGGPRALCPQPRRVPRRPASRRETWKAAARPAGPGAALGGASWDRGDRRAGAEAVARALTRDGRIDGDTETFVTERDVSTTLLRSADKFGGCKGSAALVALTLRGPGFDASEDGTGRGADDNDAQARRLIAFSVKDRGADAAEERAPTLRAMGSNQGRPNGGGQVAIAYAPRRDPGARQGWNCTVAWDGRGVRVLTPVECERLQGFPDGWTCLCGAVSEERWAPLECRCPDGPRYMALGNAIAVPQAAAILGWLAEREGGA